MALGKTRAFQTRAVAIAVLVLASFAVTCGAASAQVYWGDRPSGGWGDRRSGGWGWDDRYPSDRNYRRSPNRDFFSPFFGDRYNRPPPAVDYSKAPPPRKLETPPTSTVVVIGDSMADWLGYGLDENYVDQPEIGVERKIRATSGLVRYDAKNEALDWPQAVKDALSNEKPNAIVVMLGLNDRLPLREKTPAQQKRSGEPAQGAGQATARPANQTTQEKSTAEKAVAPSDAEAPPQDAAAQRGALQQPTPGSSYEFHTEQWAVLYAKRIDDMIAALKSKGVPVIWVGLPAVRGTKSTSDLSYLDELYRERAERAGIIYVDVWDGFVDDQGRYAVQGPDYQGQTRRLRTSDGVYFTKAGAVKLASYVVRELRRAMSSYVAPVALPGPETAPKSGPANARPDVGPVLPLSTGGGEHGDLLGAGDHPTLPTSDPTAAKALSRGEALAAPAGRADDFSWPRAGSDASATPEVPPEPVALAPGAPGKTGVKVQDQADTKKEAKEKPRTGSSASKARQAPSAKLDGPPIPPAPLGSR